MALPRDKSASLNGTRQLRDEDGAMALSMVKALLLCLVSKSIISADEALEILARAAADEPDNKHLLCQLKMMPWELKPHLR
jgi:hypothetical protein